MRYVSIIIDSKKIEFNQLFIYYIPEELELFAEIGKRVLVELGNQKVEGLIIKISDKTNITGVKPILRVLDKNPVLDEHLINLAKWMANTYLCSLSNALQTMIPSVLKKKKEEFYIPLVFSEDLLLLLNEKEQSFIQELWETGEISQKNARKKLSLDDLDVLEVAEYIKKTGTYKFTQENKEAFIYSLAQFDIEKDLASLEKKAPKQAEIMTRIIKEQSIEKHLIDSLYPKYSVQALLDKAYITISRKENIKELKKIQLSSEQKIVIDTVKKSIENKQADKYLLFGITGSGKTEIYINLARLVIERGKGVIVLVPEIALSRHLMDKFFSSFSKSVVLHSAMSQAERYDTWNRIKNGDIDLVLGTRSAVFAPLKNLGLIIIDEEQESTYKQDATPKYDARAVAEQRIQDTKAVLLMGSATPSLESFFKSTKGEYKLLSLKHRVNNAQIPIIKIMDMRSKSFSQHLISAILKLKIAERLEKNEQSLLFINRRGYSPMTICRDCGAVVTCPHCSVALTYHIDMKANLCHYCNHKEKIKNNCAVCNGNKIDNLGQGTQRIENEVKTFFPNARVARLDLDLSKRKNVQKDILEKMKSQEIDILVGTQMLAKGFDFPAITLVVIIDTDNLMHIPDFRAAERAFQLIVQVAGRAGRSNLSGEVIIQTYNPNAPLLKMAAKQDYLSFYFEEMKQRNLLHYPPYTNLLRIVLSSKQEELIIRESFTLLNFIEELIDAQEIDIAILGPAPCQIYKIKNKFRYNLLLKCDSIDLLRSIAYHLMISSFSEHIKLDIDINPLRMM